MGKDCSATDSDAAYVALIVDGGVVADRYKDATAEEFPAPPTNLTPNKTIGDSHGGERENDCDAKDKIVCDDENGYSLEERETPRDMEER